MIPPPPSARHRPPPAAVRRPLPPPVAGWLAQGDSRAAAGSGAWYTRCMPTAALVLGGGGVTGAAWEIGLLAGLAAEGVDLTGADLVVGTSAGAIVGAQVTSGASLAGLYQAQLAPPGADPVPRMGLRVMSKWARAAASSRDPVQARARLGKLALAAKTIPEQQRRQMIAARLPASEWPARRLLVTAVDAGSGEFTVFDSSSGAGLAEAVAASCAAPFAWPAISIGGRYWIDGGVRSPANADLAAGHERVVVIAPLTRGFNANVAGEVAALASDGAKVALVEPDEAAARYIGRNGLDPALRAPAARAGYAQAPAAAAQAAAVWSG
jgi:NTE family protein